MDCNVLRQSARPRDPRDSLEPSGELVMLCCRLRLPDDSPTTPAAFLRGRLRRILPLVRWPVAVRALAPCPPCAPAVGSRAEADDLRGRPSE